MTTIGKRIERARARKGITQEALAQAIGVHRTSMHAWEADKAMPRGRNLYNLAEELGVRHEWLKDGEEPMVLDRLEEATRKEAWYHHRSGMNKMTLEYLKRHSAPEVLITNEDIEKNNKLIERYAERITSSESKLAQAKLERILYEWAKTQPDNDELEKLNLWEIIKIRDERGWSDIDETNKIEIESENQANKQSSAHALAMAVLIDSIQTLNKKLPKMTDEEIAEVANFLRGFLRRIEYIQQ